MSQLRVAVSFPDSPPLDEQTEVLNELMSTMKAAMGLNERLTRLPELQLPGAGRPPGPQPQENPDEVALRVFVLDFPEGSGCAEALRAVGGWYMRHPTLTLSLKADGPGGGVNLRLTSFSTIAFAQAAAKINGLMVAQRA